MIMTSSFETFLSAIRPTATQRKAMRRGHRALRDRLNDDDKLWELTVATFIQGSYRRATAIRAAAGERSDVDVVVVTTIPQSTLAAEAQALFYDFAEKHYPKKWQKQGRSIGISLGDVDLDLVITSGPSEAQTEAVKSFSAFDTADLAGLDEERDYYGLNVGPVLLEQAKQAQWKQEPLYIPNRDLDCWDPTHPLAQIVWTRDKNAATAGHYINVVKALKWWKRNNPALPKHPKGYPLEHLIGQCCPSDITSVAEGITRTLEEMVRRYGSGTIVPFLPDHGVPSHDVLRRVKENPADFQVFMTEIAGAATLARQALDAATPKASADAWRELLGDKFPESTSTSQAGLMSVAATPSLTFPSHPVAPKGPKGFA
ncbi:SMODS domain-containing nucleotidyltransferase [Deinococcus marmoris]|uniref:SMODS domain-containing nucleotidyltransferase n=1 Tax=Deinococcus marmoris TaxID=249408 RepID=UPI00069154C6|nr:hypothetical protein [Deinococcus marmoris]